MIADIQESIQGALSRIELSSYRIAVVMPLVILLILFVGAMAVVAAEPFEIHIDGEELELSGPVRIVDGKMFVSLEDLVPITGGAVLYDENTGVARVITPDTRFMLVASRSKVYSNSEESEEIPPPIADGEHLLVWIRYLADTFEWELEWDDEARAISIETGNDTEADPATEPDEYGQHEVESDDDSGKIYDISDAELDLLKRLVTAEAYVEPFEGQIAVAAVVFNRVHSEHFPDTVKSVIKQDGQFCVVSNGSIQTQISDDARDAVQKALQGKDPSEGALFFFNPEISDSRYMHSLPVTVEIGSHRFADWRD